MPLLTNSLGEKKVTSEPDDEDIVSDAISTAVDNDSRVEVPAAIPVKIPFEFEFDDLLEQAGSFGKFQIVLVALLVVPSAAFCGLIYVAQYYILFVPDHWCELPSNLSLDSSLLHLNISAKELWIPFTAHANGLKEFSSCLINGQSNISHHEGYLLSPRTTVDGMTEYLQNTIECPDGWHYDYQDLYPTIATEKDWVCDKVRYPYHIQTMFYIGTSIGCVLFGYISDR